MVMGGLYNQEGLHPCQFKWKLIPGTWAGDGDKDLAKCFLCQALCIYITSFNPLTTP